MIHDGGNPDRITFPYFDGAFAFLLKEAASLRHQNGLPVGMGMPVGAGGGIESYVCTVKSSFIFDRKNPVCPRCAREILLRRLICPPGMSPIVLIVWACFLEVSDGQEAFYGGADYWEAS